jgi:hypothetical protein
MQADSLNTSNAAQDSSRQSGSSPVRLPTAAELGIHVKTVPIPSLVKGDTFELSVDVSWEAQGSVLLIVPASSANTKGITQLNVKESHFREIKSGKEVSSSTFIYTLSADDTGSLQIPALKFQIPTQNGPIEFASESVPVRVDGPSHVAFTVAGGIAILLIGVLAGFVCFLRKKKQKEMAKKELSTEDDRIAKDFLLLKKRLANADSREWLLALEKVCKSWAMSRFGEDDLDALANAEKLEGWAPLLEEFTHARYGGGQRDAFMNRETWKIASRLMQMTEDE